eukprot:c23940_g1_i1.p3 GENE.c23940_g1_i1~~c23940_g1_i1.p3  ORF type:complete len:113 (+),score=12.08 c23940_g1_i1:112-450(+)
MTNRNVLAPHVTFTPFAFKHTITNTALDQSLGTLIVQVILHCCEIDCLCAANWAQGKHFCAQNVEMVLEVFCQDLGSTVMWALYLLPATVGCVWCRSLEFNFPGAFIGQPKW